MNAFDKKLSATDEYPLKAADVSALQVNMGYRCNLRCTHCHVEASPSRSEDMSRATVDKLINILNKHDGIKTIDITGGSPELNENYRRLIHAASEAGKEIISRTNLAILTEPGMEDIPDLWAEKRVKVVASLPCYSEEGVDSQRGRGTFKKAMIILKHLNQMGYGQEETGLELDLMFNPAKAGVAPDQQMLEKVYREKLKEMHGVTFNRLIALSNMPIGRLGKTMSDNEKKEYVFQLEEKFNEDTVKNVMCRHLVSVSPDGDLFDCDFWQMLKLPVKSRNSNDMDSFDYALLSNREIMTASLCFMCTAGAGASCGGALA